ncbi:MAG: UDP-glucose/GDP-mannose dehydrogenase family protein, partial [Bacteroidales bacterium]|nr:UDP-glucose/GDP-mannose dehydrogenase family protein [Bacteroidales bacterium]
MKIAVIGTGYVGLVTGACFAETGVNVTCIDNNVNKINGLKNGVIPIYEPGLEAIVKRGIEKEQLSFTSSISQGITDAEVIFIAVGTPPDEDGSADLSHVLDVAKSIGDSLEKYAVIATKSTVPVGTAKKIKAVIKERLDKRGSDIEFDVASNPEFLKEGSAVEDFLKPERIILGVENDRSAQIIKRLYMPFVLNNHLIIFMDIASAEITKYAANCMLATRISFINEIANLCDILGADINEVRKAIGSDSRIGNKFLQTGPGFGGSCFPKDVKALIKTAKDNDYDLKIVSAVEKANEYQKNVIPNKITKYFGDDLHDLSFGIWGLSFKPNTDDVRESSSIYLIKKLLEKKAKIKVYDPAAM